MIRGGGLRSAVAINIATIVGAGPLITIPLVVAAMHGSISVWAWIAGALVALCDGLVYAELASRYPRSGGTYAYLREAFGAHGPGRLAAFVFVWQLLFVAPLTLASGYIGFAQYAAYIVPAAAQPLVGHAIAIAVGVITLLALYRTIPNVARTALVLGGIAVLTLVAIAACGFLHPTQAIGALLAPAFSLKGVGIAGLGAAMVFTLYDYAGYNGVCQIGDEVVAPVRTIPRAVVLSIVIVGIAYVALNLGVFSALPLSEVANSTFVASLAVERTAGHAAAIVVTVAILVTAFASTYGLLLGASRVPYAAACDGDFLAPFARLHPTKRFPQVSLVALGLLALPATLFPLDAVINVLTAGIVLVQGVGGNLAVMLLRRRAEPAPYRLPLYPLPVVVALGAWLFLFWSSGLIAMAFGVATLAVGAAIFLVHARVARAWPFALAACLLFVCAAAPHAAQAGTFTHTRIVQRDGGPQLLVDGKPFFFFGGAFFYERIPPERWRDAMLAMRATGANTLDLYVPWNWHETADGAFDFDGHTNPRRNLRHVLGLARELGFHLIVRPGPVIRNEWRNGGYPDWLLRRPDYGMPRHDVLEGRYPATATLQNAHSDDAAAEWMRNATHRRYAARWLRHALHEFVPYADLVIAVALDDDQGAYIDNQTWPAPHLQAYLRWLDAQVRSVTGPVVPTFINTYDMKVPASSPVWAMGNWYQSDAYAIGDHDRVELDFATATLTAQERTPLAASEFQAGWLASPEDPQPRAAAPSNTTLALAELLSGGAHGVVDFPLQDTLAPFGWEAPFSNAFYSWDAAIPRDPDGMQTRGRPARWAPTKRFGDDIARYGSLLAATHRVATIAIADEVSASDATALTNDDVGTIAARLKDALRACNERGLTCDVVDLRFSSDARLYRYRTIVIPPFVRRPMPAISARIARLAGAHIAVAASVPAQHGNGITVLAGRDATFGIAANWSDAPRRFGGQTWTGTRMIDVPPATVPPRDARLIILAGARPGTVANAPAAASPAVLNAPWINLNARQAVHVAIPSVPSGEARAAIGAAFGSGDRTVTLANARVVAVIVPDGGARLVVFAPRRELPYNATNATGALRDDVLLQPAPSTTDRIAKYTHSYPAGTYNRPYRAEIVHAAGTEAVVRFRYDAPDIAGGARIEKTVRLAADAMRLVVDERVIFDGSSPDQRAVTRSALGVPPGAGVETSPTFLAWDRRHAVAVTWMPGTVERATWTRYGSNGTLSLIAAASTLRTTYAISSTSGPSAARAFAREEREWLAANPNPPLGAGEVAKW